MPGLKTHCAISKKRTGMDFRELHQWIDEPSRELGVDHRKKHHAYNIAEEKQIRDYWDQKKQGLGQKAVVEWLFHIAVDNLDTAFKRSRMVYGENRYNFYRFGLTKSAFLHIDFKALDEDDLDNEFKGGFFDDSDEEFTLKGLFNSVTKFLDKI